MSFSDIPTELYYNYILPYIIKPPMKLLDWIDITQIDIYGTNYLHYLSKNPNAIDLLKENPDKICWWILSSNPNAIDILKDNPDKIDWKYLSLNPNAIELLKNRIINK